MTTTTLDATLEAVRSHSISARGNWGDFHENEELYPELKVEVGSTIREVRMEANRYLHSSGWSEWRIYVRETNPSQGIGEVTRAKIRDACTPIVEAWLESDEYVASRSRAFCWWLKQLIRDENYNLERPERTLFHYREEMNADQRELLTEAITTKRAYLEALDGIDLEAIS
jgi:hypothetical protein